MGARKAATDGSRWKGNERGESRTRVRPKNKYNGIAGVSKHGRGGGRAQRAGRRGGEKTSSRAERGDKEPVDSESRGLGRGLTYLVGPVTGFTRVKMRGIRVHGGKGIR